MKMNGKKLCKSLALLCVAAFALGALSFAPATTSAAAQEAVYSDPILDGSESEAPFPATAVATKNIKVYGKKTLKGKASFAIAKGKSFTVVTLGDNRTTLLVEYEGEQGYMSVSGLKVGFPPNTVSIYAVRKAYAYTQQANGKLKRAGYYDKGTTLVIRAIEGDYYTLAPLNGITYRLKTADWLFPMS